MFAINETFIKYSIIACLWVQYSWEMYLSYRQHRILVTAKKIPVELQKAISPATFEKSRDYALARMRFGFVKDTFDIIISTAVITFGILASFWNYSLTLNNGAGEVVTSCIWIFLLSSVSTIIELPLTIYHTFVLEEKFGFNKQTAGFFVWDKIKAFVVVQALTSLVSSVIIVTVRNGGEYFFVWLWLTICALFMVFYTIYPSVIAPIFDKYTPLPEGDLRVKIEQLATQLAFPLGGLFVVDGSKRSAHSNAYFYGLFRVKRIVLYDTLMANKDGGGCTNEEILAVLSHELGHWHHSHTLKNLFIMQMNLFLQFAGFNVLFKHQPLYNSLGFYSSQPVLVGLLVVLQYVMMPYNTLLGFLTMCMSRQFEFQADRFAQKLDRAEALINALIQLNKDNLSFPIYDHLYSSWHHTHPTLLERIQALNSVEDDAEQKKQD